MNINLLFLQRFLINIFNIYIYHLQTRIPYNFFIQFVQLTLYYYFYSFYSETRFTRKRTNDSSVNAQYLQYGGSDDYFSLIKTKENVIRRFGFVGSEYLLNFFNLPVNFSMLQKILYDAIENMIQEIFRQSNPKDKVALKITHDSLETPIYIPYMLRENLTPQVVLSHIARICQSKKDLKLHESMKIIASTIEAVSGGSNRLDKYLKSKSKAVIQINNDDNFCAIYCVIIGMKYADKKSILKRKNLSSEDRLQLKLTNNDISVFLKRKSKHLECLVYDFVQQCGLSNETCGIHEIQMIENFIEDYQILILDDKTFEWIYLGEEKEKKIFLLYREHKKHFDLIVNLPSFFGKRNYCFTCKKSYQDFDHHPCNKICYMCRKSNCIKSGPKFVCEFCLGKCKSSLCFSHHQELNICNKIDICLKCDRIKSKIHVCVGEKWCINCKKSVPMNHKCFILTQDERSEKSNSKFEGFIFFDYESMSVDGEHVPNLIIADKVCLECLKCWTSSKKSSFCTSKDCGVNYFNSNDLFCSWLLEQNDFTCIAHNLRGYDGVFIMNYLTKFPLPSDSTPEVILCGSKVNIIKFKRIRIIDSINFIPMSLSKFGKAFDLKELKKGYFPHKFNTPENQSYVGNYPDPNFYAPEQMSKSESNSFYEWYNKQNGVFDFQFELRSYCESDVDILKKGCLVYRELVMNVTKNPKVEKDDGIDPFKECITLPSLCHLVYRRNFMESKSIALINDGGFDPTQNYSLKQIMWLKFMSIKNNLKIQHCFNDKEKRFGPYSVDGYCEETNTVFEFHGCWFHGCPKCFHSSSYNPLLKQTMGYLFEKTKKKKEDIISKVSNYVEIWEHEWDLMCKSDEIDAFIKKQNIRFSLKPRDALYGGRTNAAVLFYECKESEKIKYYDFTSLYPFVQKTCEFPKGLPEVITENFTSVDKYFGLIHCQILPPTNLLFPVLPQRINNKLIFTLCLKCAENNKNKCDHNDEERCLEGCWVTEEVKEAVRNGYIIKQIFSVWHWCESSKYDSLSKSGGLFTEYVNTFLKCKQENSGFPLWVKNEDDKDKYIEKYYEKEGIRLDKNKIQKNEGLRSISKLFLNSMWGRYCLQTNKSKFKAVKTREELSKILFSNQFQVEDAVFFENITHVYYTDVDSLHEGGKDSNVVLGAFITCYGRLKLYDELKKLNERVLYFDTDSLIFISRPNEYEPQLGDFLGEFTNEIENDDYIYQFVSAGPKNYAYKTIKGNQVCKVKGFFLGAKASTVITFDSIANLVQNQNTNDSLFVEQLRFKRSKINWSIRTDLINKKYKQVYDKRILKSDLTTIPFGFRN